MGGKDRKPVSHSNDGSFGQTEDPQTAQLFTEDGVPTSVGTIAIDRSMLAMTGVAPQMQGEAGASAAVINDAEVMLRVKTGDESAFDYLLQKYRRPIISFLYRMVHSSAAAEELAQEVFLRVYRSRDGYEASAKFTTWLYRIATNLAVNYVRDTRHERPENMVSLDEPDEATGQTPDVADGSLTAEESIARGERLAAIRRRVQELPERQRLAVIMHKYQQMDYRQIAEVLKLSESATKSLLFRAYETLRVQLKEFV